MGHYLHPLYLNPKAAVRAHGFQKLTNVPSCWDKFYHQLLTAFSSITTVYSHVYWYNTTLLEINSKTDLSFLVLNMPFSFSMHRSSSIHCGCLKMPRHLLKICSQTIRKQSSVAVCKEQCLSPGTK